MSTFKDINFKLAVINELIQLGHFEKEVEKINDNFDEGVYDKYFEKAKGKAYFGPHPDVLKFFRDLDISQQQLDEIKKLDFDGGNEIYQILAPNWDGEDDQFTVKSLDDVLLLKNLERLNNTVLMEVKDCSALLKLGNLKYVDSGYEGFSIKDQANLKLLKDKGVEVKR